MFSGLLQPTHLIIILVIVLIIFGPGKLPDIGKAVGKTISEFRQATNISLDDGQGTKQAKQEAAGQAAQKLPEEA